MSYSILINGELEGYIVPTRGIRQGDPLSPYLFILCAEGLSSLITQSVNCGLLKSLVMCPSAPVIHHLLFADDSFLFGKATERECLKIRHILNIYEKASGQKINLQKSSVVFSKNTSPEIQASLSSILGVTCVEQHGLYLGLPIHVGMSKSAIFEYLKERLMKKLVSWRSKLLSSAGKEILIKVVAQIVPLYAMNCYLLPMNLCDELHRLCAQFFWGSTDEKHKIHWRAWDRMCLSKAEGGMGFKNLHAYNLAMLAKQGWRLLTNPSSLIAHLYKAVYFPDGNFLTAHMGDAPSFSWGSIINARHILQAGLVWKVGYGMDIRIWDDNWIPNVPYSMLQRPTTSSIPTLVSELLHADTMTWNIPLLYSLFPPDIVEVIMCLPLSLRRPREAGFFLGQDLLLDC